MKGFVFEGPGEVHLRDVPEPRLDDQHDAIVAVEATGVCGTDLRIVGTPPLLAGRPGAVLGHEIVGRVIEAGSKVGVAPGVRVVIEPNVVCGSCAYCFEGRSNLCRSLRHLGTHLPGGFAERVVVPGTCLVPIPDRMPLAQAILAEGLACVLNATRRAELHPGKTAVVFGAGPIGMLFLAVLRSAGLSRVVVTELSPARAVIARQRGALATVIADNVDVPEAVHSLLPEGADLVIDTVGTLLADAIETVRPGGRIIVFGLADEAEVVIRPTLIAKREISIQGSYITHGLFHPALRLLESGQLDVDDLLAQVFPLDRIDDAFALALQRGAAIKVAVGTMSSSGEASSV